MSNHYIRLGAGNVVTLAFSDAFQKPEQLDIMIAQDAGRHCLLDVRADGGGYRYRWDAEKKELVERTPDEIEPLADLKARLKLAEEGKAANVLRATELPVQRYLEQKATGGSTTMSAEDFAALVGEREAIRLAMDTAKTEIDEMTTRASLEARG